MDIGSAVGRASGLSTDKILALADWRGSPLYDELERDALALAEHMAEARVDVPEALYARLAARLSEAQLVELAAVIAWENFRARFNRVFQLGSDGFASEGAVCVIPERPRPSAPQPPGGPA